MSEPPQTTTTIQASADVVKQAVTAMSSSPMCLAVVLVSLAFCGAAMWSIAAERENRHEEMMNIYSRCFAAGREK